MSAFSCRNCWLQLRSKSYKLFASIFNLGWLQILNLIKMDVSNVLRSKGTVWISIRLNRSKCVRPSHESNVHCWQPCSFSFTTWFIHEAYRTARFLWLPNILVERALGQYVEKRESRECDMDLVKRLADCMAFAFVLIARPIVSVCNLSSSVYLEQTLMWLKEEEG